MRYGAVAIAVAGMIGAMGSGRLSAENRIDNSSFYSTISPWKTFTPDLAYFTTTMNHTPGGGGSVFLGGASSGSIVSQCVDIYNGSQHVISAWTYSACVGSRLYAFYSTSCDVGSESDFARSSVANEWQQLTIVSNQSPEKNHAIVVLDNPGGCGSGVYFDDVVVQVDDIFWDTFDPHGVSARLDMSTGAIDD